MAHTKAFLILLGAAAIGVACQSPLDMMEQKARPRVEESLGRAPQPEKHSDDPRPRLAVDVTQSMAGYIAPPGKEASEFSRALEIVASALPEHELFVHGARRAGENPSVPDLLTLQPAGLGNEFARDRLFTGANNQDDLLFEAVGSEELSRPLVLFTDGVYSSPGGEGVQPVAQVLDKLLQNNWSLGFIALRSAYYGTRCELTSRGGCRDERLFYSEASQQKTGEGFIPLPCSIVRNRPFYVVVLSPNSELFQSLYALLGKNFQAEAGFLLEGDTSPVTLGKAQPLFTGAEVPPISRPLGGWLMFDGDAGPNPGIEVEYSIAPRFPVDVIGWTIRAEQMTWDGSTFGPWRPEGAAQIEPDKEAPQGVLGGLTIQKPPKRLPWRSFPRDLEDLYASFQVWMQESGELADPHRAAADAIRDWHPSAAERQTLYCEYLDQPSRTSPSRNLSILRILLAVDAQRRRQPGEVSIHLNPLLLSAPGSVNADLIELAKALERSRESGFAERTALSEATSVTLPAGRPSTPTPRKDLGADPDQSDAKQLGVKKTLQIKLPSAGESRTYRLHLVPYVLGLSPALERLSTGDDSDIGFANRTYRLENLIRYLASAQLERIGKKEDLKVFVTVPVD